MGSRLFAKLIRRFSEKYPLVHFHLYNEMADNIKDRMDKGLIDVGLLLEPVDTAKYDFVRLSQKETWGVLMRDDLQDVPRALRLSALTLRDIKENLFWAFCYNTIGIPIAAGVLYAFGGPLLSPMFAGAAMSLSSVCVVGNALRLGRAKL